MEAIVVPAIVIGYPIVRGLNQEYEVLQEHAVCSIGELVPIALQRYGRDLRALAWVVVAVHPYHDQVEILDVMDSVGIPQRWPVSRILSVCRQIDIDTAIHQAERYLEECNAVPY